MVSWTAFADGATREPAASSLASIAVSIASISGTITSGRCFSTAARTAAPSSIGNTSNASETCIAGALSYRSQAMTLAPSRFAAIANSRPSSPEPRSIKVAVYMSGR